MTLSNEQFKTIFNDYKKGKNNNIYIILDNSMILILKQLLSNGIINRYTIFISFNALLSSIHNYSYEKASSFYEYAQEYIRICLEKKYLLIPTIVLPIEKEEEYLERINNLYNKIVKTEEKVKIFKKTPKNIDFI